MSETTDILTQHGRTAYVPSGRVAWRLMLLYTIEGILLSATVGALLYLALLGGLYFMFVTPLLLAGLTGCIAYKLVEWSHCRNVALATTVGIALGGLMFLSHYQSQVVHELGLRGLFRVDLLPLVVLHRLETDAQESRPGAAGDNGQSSGVLVNGALAIIDFLICVAISGTFANQSARKVYDEASGRWTTQKAITFAPGSGVPIVSALFTHQLFSALSSFPRINPVSTKGSQPVTSRHCLVVLDYSRGKHESIPAACYLSVNEGPGNILLQQCKLTPEECEEIASLL